MFRNSHFVRGVIAASKTAGVRRKPDSAPQTGVTGTPPSVTGSMLSLLSLPLWVFAFLEAEVDSANSMVMMSPTLCALMSE